MSLGGCCWASGGQLLAVLSKNARVERRHAARFGCELLFPVFIIAAISLGFLAGGEPMLEVLKGSLSSTEIPPQLLPAVYPTGECDGTPASADLQVSEPPYGTFRLPPCFGHVDGRAVAVQCRCRTLRIAGEPGLRDGFRDFLREAGVEDLIRDFTLEWRAEKSATCPERDTFELAGSDDLTVGDGICGVVSFTDAGNIAVRVDVTADAAVYRPTLEFKSQLEVTFGADTCDQVPWYVEGACSVTHDLYQRHASANLHYLAGMFLAERNPSPAVGSAALSALLRPNASLTVYNMPQRTRVVESRGQSLVSSVSSFVAFFMAFPFILWVFVLVSALVGEREKRLKEGMRVMGLRSSSFYLSWLLWTLVRAVVVGLLMGLMALAWPLSARGFVVFCWVCISGLMYTFAFSAVISTFFSNERTGAMIAAMLYFLLMIPAPVPTLSSLPYVVVCLMCFPSYWLITGMKHVIFYESMDWVAGVSLEGFHIGAVIAIGNLLTVLWYLLYLYLEQVVQQSVGQSRGPCFCFRPSFWREVYVKPALDKEPNGPPSPPGVASTEDDQRETDGGEGAGGAAQGAPAERQMVRASSKVQEVVDARLVEHRRAGRCVEATDLEVVFTGVHGEEIRAVDGLRLVMYPDEIFVLLGHNGAGKTTTIGVLAGLVRPTGGSVRILGKSMPARLHEIRESLGLCPQHNVLWDELTCLEHMDFFLRLRGGGSRGRGTDAARRALASELLEEVGLGPRIHYRSSSLSGGMKRKLSVAIAFNGSPGFVILDEPTSGMDPFSRRVLWDFVKHRREGRVVLLTTHFMDEADVLADRIAVMAHGRLQTYGDPQFLKRKFGCGYIVTVVLAESGRSRESCRKALEADVKQAMHGVEGISVGAVGKEVLIQVPFYSASSLPQLFRLLNHRRESKPESGAVASFGVSVSSLEEVFLKIASGNVSKVEEDAAKFDAPTTEAGAAEEGNDSTSTTTTADAHVGELSPAPLTEATATTATADAHVGAPPPPPLTEATADGDPAGFGLTSLPANSQLAGQMRALLARRAKSATRDRRTFCLVCLVSPVTLLIGCFFIWLILRLMNSLTSVTVQRLVPELDAAQVIWGSLDTNPFPGVPSAQTVLLTEQELEQVDASGNRSFGGTSNADRWVNTPFVRPVSTESIVPPDSYCQDTGLDNVSCPQRWRSHVVLFAEKVVEMDGEWQAAVVSVDGHLTVWANDVTQVHGVPMALNALLGKAWNSDVSVSTGMTANDPPVSTAGITLSGSQVFEYLMPIVLISVAFAFVPTGIMQFMMVEKCTGTKSQLLISGCTYHAYWFSNLLWDMMFGLPPVLVACLFFWAFDFVYLLKDMGVVVVMMLLFIPGACGFAYVGSQLSSSEAMGTTLMLSLNGLLGTALVLCVILGDLIVALLTLTFALEGTGDLEEKLAENSAIFVAQVLHDIGLTLGMPLPGFSLAAGLFRMSVRHLIVYRILPGVLSVQQLEQLLNELETQGASSVADASSQLTQVAVDDAAESTVGLLQDITNISVDVNGSGGIGDALDAAQGVAETALDAAQGAGVLQDAVGLPVGEAVEAAQEFVLEAVSTLVGSIRSALPSQEEVGRILDEDVFPPLLLASSLQVCYLGTTGLQLPLTLGGFGQLAPLTVRVPCNFLLPPEGQEQGEYSIGPMVDQIMGLFCVGDSLVHLAVLAVVWPLLAVLVEAMVQSPRMSRSFVPKDQVPQELLPTETDSDVEAERRRVEALDASRQIIFVRNLRRAYKRPNELIAYAVVLLVFAEVSVMLAFRQTLYVILAVNLPVLALLFAFSWWWAPLVYWRVKETTHAVRGVSWASSTGMVFGLLGVNGAGKTTTFQLMSGLRTPSAGEVKILGMDVQTQVEACRRYIGYCPQFDCILPLLTPEDHLYLFGRIKGLSGKALDEAVESKLEEMQLSSYRSRYAGTLSGGNKRKLSVAIALIGEPPIIFLDEPSTGMDPFARRFMWKVIDDVAEKRKKSVVVLTTHSMEEGEALCSKVAIQVDGQLRCLGSVQQVKSRYGTGYEVPVKFNQVGTEQRERQRLALEAAGLRASGADLVTAEQATAALGQGEGAEAKARRMVANGGPFSMSTGQVPHAVFVDWCILDAQVQSLVAFLGRRSGGQPVALLEHHGLSARLRLPELADPSLLSALFEGLLEEADLGLDDFAVCQSSLEQVFNDFARQAGETRESA